MSRFQQGSLFKLSRKSCPDVWVFRWYDNSSGTRSCTTMLSGRNGSPSIQSAASGLHRNDSTTRTFSLQRNFSAWRNSSLYATGQWYWLPEALACAVRR